MGKWSLFIKNPKNDVERNITGRVTTTSFLGKSTPNVDVKGLPKPYTTTGSVTLNGKTAQEIANEGEFTITGNISSLPNVETGVGSLDYAIKEALKDATQFINNIYDTDIGDRLVWEELPPEELPSEEVLTNTPNNEPVTNQQPVGDKVVNKNSKITLSIKSGPGEISGVTELPLENNRVNFSKIQFTEPGEYVVSVIPSNTEEIEPTEFTINVESEEVIPQENSDEVDEEKPKIDGTRPIIAQITQPSIKLEPMEFDASTSEKDNEEVSGNLGYTPFVWYNGIQIKTADISSLYLYYENKIPMCIMTIRDTLGLINSPETSPLNNTKFEVFLNSGSDILKSIHLKFKLEVNSVNKNGTNTITGALDMKDYHKKKYDSKKGTSFNVLKEIATDLELGYNSNITNTDDDMKWRRKGITYSDYIDTILKHSYISDDSFLRGYIDYYWSFNYVDIEKEWKRDISKDIGLITQGVSSVGEPEIVEMSLTNDRSMNSSPFYFTNQKLKNNSTFKNMNKGIFTVSKTYDRQSKQFLIFNIDSITSDASKNVILKGDPLDTEESETNFSTSYKGKIDTDNVHKNYTYAFDQNKRNLENLTNISLDMTLPQANFNLYLYQKIRIDFINEKQTLSNEKYKDERLSGDWLIIDISFNWTRGSLTQKLTVVRKELGKTTSEQNEQKVSEDPTVNNSEINENPIDEDINDVEEPSVIDGFDFGDEEVEEVTDEEFLEEEFLGADELAIESQERELAQSESLNDLTEKREELEIDNIDYNNPVFTGELWKNYDIETVISQINRTEHKPRENFTKYLRKTLYWIKGDKDITDARQAAYLLGTAFAESNYSLQRWEADYVCRGAGVPYGSEGPCNSALKYYKSTKGKKDYYSLGVDSKGFPYFGRGLIQLTGKDNYKKYGEIIGQNLVGDGDLALREDNSYKITVAYLKARTFKYVIANNLERARRSVNGGTKGIGEVNGAYKDWLKIFTDNTQVV